MKRIVLIFTFLASLTRCIAQDESPQQRISRFTLLIQTNPDSVALYVQRSEAYNDNKAYQLAIDDCNKILTVDANNKEALKNRGHAY